MQGKRICVRQTPDLLALGSAVREKRARHALSQEALGFASGLHRNYIGSIERGEINATFRTLLRLTGGLRMKLSDLIVIYERNMGEPTWWLADATG
jgi:transcriptional regulator with XRE-family HTH domain